MRQAMVRRSIAFRRGLMRPRRRCFEIGRCRCEWRCGLPCRMPRGHGGSCACGNWDVWKTHTPQPRPFLSHVAEASGPWPTSFTATSSSGGPSDGLNKGKGDERFLVTRQEETWRTCIKCGVYEPFARFSLDSCYSVGDGECNFEGGRRLSVRTTGLSIFPKDLV